MPERLREAIASVRRISSEGALGADDQWPEERALQQTNGGTLDAEDQALEPPAPWETSDETSVAEDRELEPPALWGITDEPSGGEDRQPGPHALRETSGRASGAEDQAPEPPALSEMSDETSVAKDRELEPPALWETSDETSGAEDRELEPPALWEITDEPSGGKDRQPGPRALRETSGQASGAEDQAPEPPALMQTNGGKLDPKDHGPEPPAVRETSDKTLDTEDREPRPPALSKSVERGPPARFAATRRRGVHIGAFLVAAALVLVVGLGIGSLREVGDLERRSSPSAAGAVPESGVAPGAQELPPINEIIKVQPLQTSTTPAEEGLRSDQAPSGALPLPPPPKPAPWSAVKGEEQPRTDRIDRAVDALLRQAGGLDGPFAALADEAVPPSGSPRVLIHYTGNTAGGEATAMHLARLLSAKGFAVEAREVDFPIPSDSIRYFFAGDRDAAEALRSSLDGQIPGGVAPPVVDFTRDEPKPRQGSLELWIRT